MPYSMEVEPVKTENQDESQNDVLDTIALKNGDALYKIEDFKGALAFYYAILKRDSIPYKDVVYRKIGLCFKKCDPSDISEISPLLLEYTADEYFQFAGNERIRKYLDMTLEQVTLGHSYAEVLRSFTNIKKTDRYRLYLEVIKHAYRRHQMSLAKDLVEELKSYDLSGEWEKNLEEVTSNKSLYRNQGRNIEYRNTFKTEKVHKKRR